MAKEKNTKASVVRKLDAEGRGAALETVEKSIEKEFGKGSLFKLGQRKAEAVPVIPTGITSLDTALGVGGFPRGRIIEMFGPESSGKTTLALMVVAQAQKVGGTAAFIDAEHALDPVYASKLGVDIDELYVSQPDNGEQALDIAESLVSSGAIDVVVIDSVAALVPRAEIEGDMGDSHVGLQARLMSQALRKMAGVISKTNSVVIFLNQLREKIGGYGSPETTTGGNALKFYASIRLDLRPKDKLKEGKQIVGNRVQIKVVKNKVAPPFRMTIVENYNGEGFSTESDLLTLAVEYRVVRKAGAYYYYQKNDAANEECIGQGLDNAITYLKKDAVAFDEIQAKVRNAILSGKEPDELISVPTLGDDEIQDDDDMFELD